MSQLSRKFKMRLRRIQPKSQKNRRTRRSRTEREIRTRADAGVTRRVSVPVLTNMASAMTARGLRLDLLGDHDTAFSCKAFHIDRQTHSLIMARTMRTSTAYRWKSRVMSEDDSDRQNPRSEKVRYVCCRCRTADDWSMRTGRQPEGPLRRTGQAPDTSCAMTRKMGHCSRRL